MELLQLIFSALCWIGLAASALLTVVVAGLRLYIGEDFKEIEEQTRDNSSFLKTELETTTRYKTWALGLVISVVFLSIIGFFSLENLALNIMWVISTGISYWVSWYNVEKQRLPLIELVSFRFIMDLGRFIIHVSAGLVWFFGV